MVVGAKRHAFGAPIVCSKLARRAATAVATTVVALRSETKKTKTKLPSIDDNDGDAGK